MLSFRRTYIRGISRRTLDREVVEQIARAEVGACLGNQFRTLQGLAIPVGGAVNCQLKPTLLR